MPTTDIAQSTGDAAAFHYLPEYAVYLLQYKLRAFSETVLQVSRELDLPLLRHFDFMTPEQLIALSMEGNAKLFKALSGHTIADYLAENLRVWKENRLPQIQSDDVVIEDISKANFARRKAFRSFLPGYSSDAATCIAMMDEVDRFTLMQEETSYKTLFELKERKIREHNHFIDKINNASPGIIYVYDLQSGRQLYSNHRRKELLGYSDAEMAEVDDDVLNRLIHPDDHDVVKQHWADMADIADGELRTAEFRVRDKLGIYLWQRAYETVFRRHPDGAPAEIIGISIDVTGEKEASSQLELREQQLREAQEIAGIGSFEWDLAGNASIVSPQLLRIFEMEERGNLPDFLQYVHPADRESVQASIDAALTGDGLYESEYRYRKSGPEKMIWSRGKVVFEEGRAVRLKGTVMDVTLRHDMLKRLAHSEQLHKQAQALTHLGNWSWSLADDHVEWSDEMYRIFGLPPQSETMTLDRILTFVHPGDRERQRSILHNALSKCDAENYVMRVMPGDGGPMKYVEGKSEVLCDEAGKPYKIAGTCQDITGHRMLHERLKENEEASRQLINNAPEAIIVIDEHSNILLWNPKAEAIFGWSPEEVRNKRLTETIIPLAYRQAHSEGIHRLRTTGESRVLNKTIEIEALKKSGETFFISLTISRSVRAGQSVYIAFMRDISDERATALQLEEQRNQLAQKNRALERSNQELTAFNYIASHDLKEPVRKIKVFSDIINHTSATASLPQSMRDAMSRITASADHMERLIDALIVFSRTDTGERRFERIALEEVVAGAQLVLRDKIEDLGATIITGPLPELSVIPFQIEQLFENLIGNALKYSKPGVPPRIVISAAQVPGSAIEDEGAGGTGLYHRISIADNGIGFEQQYATKVFEVFQRLHSKDAYGGTGIGLAICKKIVAHHEGFITAHGVPGQGAQFDVFLPVAEE